MNCIKKLYCRAFQFCFKIAIPVLPYRNPQIAETVERVALILREKGYKKPLVVTDKIIRETPAFKKMEKAFDRTNICYAIYDKTVANPTVKNVEEAREIYLTNNCDALIAFGGGSSIDCAKAVGARIARKNKPICKMEGILRILKKIPFLISVPTTAGTGSEVTVTMVITDEETRHKFPISDFCLIPSVAVHDPETIKTLPKNIVATTGMDALTHAVEAYIGNSTTKDTRHDALFALELIFENLYTVYEDIENKTARANMLYASFLAGRAFSKSYVGYCHAVAHSLGGKYNIPHGLANAVLLPYTLRAYGKSAHKKLWELAVKTKLCDENTSYEQGASIFIEKIEKMNESMGIPKKLKGINKEDIPHLAAYADKEANPLYPVPCLFDASELEKLYYSVMEEKHD